MKLLDIIIRGVVTAKNGARKMRTLQIKLLDRDVREPVEHFEPYGFTGEPHDGAEVLAVSLGGDREHTIAAIVTDRRHRPTDLKSGEVVIYDDLGRKVYISREGIKVEGKDSPITVTTTGNVTVKGAKITLDGEVEITKNLKVTGDVMDKGGSYSMSGMRSTYNSHKHGDSSTPSPTM